jgi:hypothetical protein
MSKTSKNKDECETLRHMLGYNGKYVPSPNKDKHGKRDWICYALLTDNPRENQSFRMLMDLSFRSSGIDKV